MATNAAGHLDERAGARTARRSPRARGVLLIGPLTMLAGVVWALVQPWRITLLHPHRQGFWWLFVQAPIWVVLVGLLFTLVVAPGVVADLERAERGGAS